MSMVLALHTVLISSTKRKSADALEDRTIG